MDLGENIKKSFVYPLCDYNKFAMIGVLSVFLFCIQFVLHLPGIILA